MDIRFKFYSAYRCIEIQVPLRIFLYFALSLLNNCLLASLSHYFWYAVRLFIIYILRTNDGTATSYYRINAVYTHVAWYIQTKLSKSTKYRANVHYLHCSIWLKKNEKFYTENRMRDDVSVHFFRTCARLLPLNQPNIAVYARKIKRYIILSWEKYFV